MWDILRISIAEGQYTAMRSLYWKQEAEDNEISTNEGSSKYLRTADQGIDPSIMRKRPVQEYECKRNEVSYP